jgi:hypothetical protein
MVLLFINLVLVVLLSLSCSSFFNESPGMHGENHLFELTHPAGMNVVLLQGADLG